MSDYASLTVHMRIHGATSMCENLRNYGVAVYMYIFHNARYMPELATTYINLYG